jgi:hypothetical protein
MQLGVSEGAYALDALDREETPVAEAEMGATRGLGVSASPWSSCPCRPSLLAGADAPYLTS